MNLLSFIASLEAAKISPEQILLALKEHLHLQKEEVRQRVKKHRNNNKPVTNIEDVTVTHSVMAVDGKLSINNNKPVTQDMLHSQNHLLTKEVSKKEREVSKKERIVSKVTGTRFALSSIPEDWKEFCFDKRPDLNPDDIFDSFRDFWISKAGAGGNKLDWFATWRNWVRTQKNTGFNGHARNYTNGAPIGKGQAALNAANEALAEMGISPIS